MILALPCWLLCACAAGPPAGDEASPVRVELDGVAAFPNMLRLRFFDEDRSARAAWIEVEGEGFARSFGASEALAREDAAGAAFVALAPGLPPEALLRVQPWVEVDGELQALAPLEWTSGALPAELFAPVVQGQLAPVWSFSSLGLGTWGPILLSPEGLPAWWSLPGWESTAVVRARPHPDGSGVVFGRFPILAAGDQATVPSGFVHMGWQGAVLAVEERPAAHHDFVFLPDGGRAWIEFEDREIDGLLVRGDRLVRAFPDGAEQVLWSAFDRLEYDADRVEEIAGIRWWTLANSLEYDESRDRFLLSLKNLDAVLAIDAVSGESLWRLSAEGGDLPLLPPATPFVGQHGIEATGDGFLLFDNGGGEDGASRVLSLRVDEAAGTATQQWERGTDPPHHGIVLGDVRSLPGGGARIVWSALAILEDLDADQQPQGRIEVAPEGYLGFLHVEELLLPPPP